MKNGVYLIEGIVQIPVHVVLANEVEGGLHVAFSLYIHDISNIIEKEGMSMTIVEKNIREWADKLGLKEKYIKEGEKRKQLSVARKMLAKGFSIDDIIDTTGLSMDEIRTLQEASG